MKVYFSLISILYIICIAVSFHRFASKRLHKHKLFSGIFFIVTIINLLELQNDTMYSFAFIFIAFIQLLVLKISISNTKFISIAYLYVVFYSVNCILSSCLTIYMGDYFYVFSTDIITNFITSILYISFVFLHKKETLNTFYTIISSFQKILFLLILIFNTLLIVLLIDENFYAQTEKWFSIIQRISISTIILSFVTVLLLLYATISNTRLKQLTENYEKQINIQSEHYKKLAAANVDVRRFKHDFKNMSIAIEKLLSDGNTEEALNLLKSSVNSFDSHDNTINPFKSGNPVADALLADKQKMAQSAGATIEFEGAIPAELLSPTDICVLLGNTLDNAIEACQKFPHNIPKTIHISANCVGSIAFIMIDNPVTEKANIKNNHIKTSKENKTLHGFGLYSLNSIVKKYSGTLKISSTDSKFTVEMSLFFNNRTKN